MASRIDQISGGPDLYIGGYFGNAEEGYGRDRVGGATVQRCRMGNWRGDYNCVIASSEQRGHRGDGGQRRTVQQQHQRRLVSRPRRCRNI